MLKDLCGAICIGFIFIIAVFTGSNKLQEASCREQWKDAFPYKYNFIGGCKIQIPDGKWIPAENYREVI